MENPEGSIDGFERVRRSCQTIKVFIKNAHVLPQPLGRVAFGVNCDKNKAHLVCILAQRFVHSTPEAQCRRTDDP